MLPKKKNVHACFNAIWPKFTASPNLFIKWPICRLCVSLVFGRFRPIIHNLKHNFHCPVPVTNCRSPWFQLECSEKKFVDACFNAIWPKFTASLKLFIKWPKGRLCVLRVFGHFSPIFHNLKHISHCHEH